MGVTILGFQALNQNRTGVPIPAQPTQKIPNSAKYKRPSLGHGAVAPGPSKEKKIKESKKVMSKEILDGSSKKNIIGSKKVGFKEKVGPYSGKETTGIRIGAGSPGKVATVPSKRKITGSKKVKTKEILEPDATIVKQICSPEAPPVRGSKEKKTIKSKKVETRKISDCDSGDDDSGIRKENISPRAVTPGSGRKKSRENMKVKSKEILVPDSGDTSNPADDSNFSDDVSNLREEEVFSDNCGEELTLNKKEQEGLVRAKEKMKAAAYERRKRLQTIRSRMNRELKAKREADILKENDNLKKQVQNFAKAIEEYYSSHELSGLKTEKVKSAVTKWIKNKL